VTTFLLIRHGANDFIGHTLVGRRPGVHLNAEGRAQAESLVPRLAGMPIRALYSSPLERAQETAAPLAERLGLPVQTLNDIIEIDPGDWAGRTIDELRDDPVWDAYNAYRCGNRCPNGELVIELQARVVTALERLRHEHDGEVVALFSHADPIKAAVMY
jgi:probable phosphoglycerate mutase